MRNIANYITFQAGWLACVGAGLAGWMWYGPLAVAAILVLHLTFITRPGERSHELRLIVLMGVAGTLLDSLLHAAGLVNYPSSEATWAFGFAPPWIAALWFLFGTLPRHSLSWIGGRPLLAAVLGAIGGPMSFWAGQRLGVIETGGAPFWTYAVLAAEYAACLALCALLPPVAELKSHKTLGPHGGQWGTA
ncbi:MAG: hypothetical protein ACI9D0_002190 [Bacteroidia bacterium]|jgi:hypothetical protein